MHLGTRSLTLTVDGIPRTADVSNCRITSGPHPNRAPMWSSSNPDAARPREYRLQCIAAQDLSPDSLWDLAWSRYGETVDIDLRPSGGVVPTYEQPWFSGTVTIQEPDGDLIGGQADASPSARFTFEIDWPFEAKPTRIDA